MQVFDTAFKTQGWLRLWFAPWYRWDTAWYILIAKEGYSVSQESIVFPPLYPFLIRVLAPIFAEDYLVASLVISNIASIIFLWLLFNLVRKEYGVDAAKHSLFFIICFPAGFFLVAGYTESIFLAFAIGAWTAFKNKKFFSSGVLGLLATLTRSQGWVLGVTFAFILITEIISSKEVKKVSKFVTGIPAILGPIFGEIIYIAGMKVLGFGNIADVFEGQYWNIKIQLPSASVINALRHAVTNEFVVYDWVNFFSLIIVL